MKLASLLTLSTLVITLSLTGCDDGPNCPGPDPNPNPCPNSVDLRIHNESGSDISTLQLSPSATEDWGNNQLDETLLDGDDFTLYCVPCGKEYDVRALSGPFEIAEEYELFLRCGSQPELTIE